MTDGGGGELMKIMSSVKGPLLRYLFFVVKVALECKIQLAAFSLFVLR